MAHGVVSAGPMKGNEWFTTRAPIQRREDLHPDSRRVFYEGFITYFDVYRTIFKFNTWMYGRLKPSAVLKMEPGKYVRPERRSKEPNLKGERGTSKGYVSDIRNKE